MELNFNKTSTEETITYKGGNIPGVPVGEAIPVSEFIAAYLEYASVSLDLSTELDADNVIVNASTGGCADGVTEIYGYSWLTNTSGIQYNWDLSGLGEGLPVEAGIRSHRVILTSSTPTKGRLIDTANPVGAVQVQLSDFPLTVKVESVVSTKCGNKTFEAFDTLTNPTDTYKTSIYLESREVSPTRTLTEKLAEMERRLTLAERTVTVDGKSFSIQEAIIYLANKMGE